MIARWIKELGECLIWTVEAMTTWWKEWMSYVVIVALSGVIVGLAAKVWWRLLLFGWRWIP